jgi:hypothetical protein
MKLIWDEPIYSALLYILALPGHCQEEQLIFAEINKFLKKSYPEIS